MKFVSPVQASLTIAKLYDLAEAQRAVEVLQAAGLEVSILSLSVSAAVAPIEKPAA